MDPVIVARGLSKTYESAGRRVKAVQDVSFEVRPGEVFGLFGPNGAGKSTLVRMLATLLLPSNGTASVNGLDVVKQERAVRRIIGLVAADERSFYGRLTAAQNLAFYAGMQGVRRREIPGRIAAVLDLFGLVSQADAATQSLSTGQRQRLNMARALVHNPPILFLDEPTKSMDVQTADFVRILIKEELSGRQGKTIVFISHEFYEMENFCDRVLILANGRARVSGSPAELAAQLPRRALYRVVVEGDSAAIADRWRRLEGVEAVSEVSRGTATAAFDVALADEKSGAWLAVLDTVGACGGRVESYRRVDDESLRRIVAHFSGDGGEGK